MSRRKGLAFISCLVIAATLPACNAAGGQPTEASAAAGDLRLTGVWARPAGAGETTAVYLTITNEGAQSDALLGASCPIAAMCELHETRAEGDVIHMEHQDRLELPAGSEVSLEPGGAHIMLMDLQSELAPGDLVSLVLRFEVAGEIPVEAEVVAP